MSMRDEIRWHAARLTGSEDCPPFGVLKITGAETVAGRTRYTVAKPDTTFERLYVVNGPATFKAGADYGGSVTFDIAYALCDSSVSPLYGESWGAKHSQWKLFQHRPGFFMLGNYQGTGDEQRAQVRQQEVLQLRGVLDGTLSEGGSATMSIYFRDGATWTDSTMNQTVYDDLLEASGSLPSTTIVIARFYGDRWWVQEARCP